MYRDTRLIAQWNNIIDKERMNGRTNVTESMFQNPHSHPFITSIAQHRVLKKNIYVSQKKKKPPEQVVNESEEDADAVEGDPDLPVIKFDMTSESGKAIEPPAPVGIGESQTEMETQMIALIPLAKKQSDAIHVYVFFILSMCL